MATEAAQASWFSIVLLSAGVSAAVNLLSNFYIRRGERKKSEAKETQRINHVYLDVLLQLHTFAKRAKAYGDDLAHATAAFKAGAEEIDALRRFDAHPLMLTFDPEPKWGELPVPFVSQAKALPGNFVSCGEWISRPWSTWAGRGDAYVLNRQRIAFYGLRALEISDEIKFAIHPNTETLAEIDEARAGFNDVIRTYRKLSNEGSEPLLIPELAAQYEKERSQRS